MAAWLTLSSLGLSAGAQAQEPAGSGLQIQPPSAVSSPRITLDGPRRKGPLPIIYLDGQRRDSMVLAKVSPETIARVEVPKNAAIAHRLGPDEARLGVIFITTKAGEHSRRVRTFNRRLARLGRARHRGQGQPQANRLAAG